MAMTLTTDFFSSQYAWVVLVQPSISPPQLKIQVALAWQTSSWETSYLKFCWWFQALPALLQIIAQKKGNMKFQQDCVPRQNTFISKFQIQYIISESSAAQWRHSHMTKQESHLLHGLCLHWFEYNSLWTCLWVLSIWPPLDLPISLLPPWVTIPHQVEQDPMATCLPYSKLQACPILQLSLCRKSVFSPELLMVF